MLTLCLSQTSQNLLEGRTKLTARFLRNREQDYLVENARLLDNYFRESFAASVIGPRIGILKNPYAIIALGGYGRQEQHRQGQGHLGPEGPPGLTPGLPPGDQGAEHLVHASAPPTGR